MNHPTHHLPDPILARYVAGSAEDAEALVAACHLTLCGTCQARAHHLEAIAGAALEAPPHELVAPVGDDALAAVLARLDEPPPPRLPVAPDGDGTFPRPLLRRLGGPPRWKWLVPGIHGVDVPVRSPVSAVRLLRLVPKMRIPLHDHEGAEYTVVLSGGIEDESGVYHRGDFAARGAGDRHTQRVLPGEACVALVVNVGALVPLTLTGRIVKALGRER